MKLISVTKYTLYMHFSYCIVSNVVQQGKYRPTLLRVNTDVIYNR